MKISQIIQETSTTAGSVAPVEHGFVKMQTRNPGVYGGNKVGNLLKGKKTSKPFANSVNESAEISETDLSEQDLIVVPGQGRLKKSGFIKHDPDKAEHEGETLKNSLHTIVRVASHLNKELSVKANFPEWVSEKIGAVKSDMVSVMDYIISSKEMQRDPDTMESLGTTGAMTNGEMGESKDRVDSLVTDALKIIRGSDYQIEPVKALKIVLGDREYNSRRGFYNFYVRQLMDMLGQEGLAEGNTEVRDNTGKVVSWRNDTEWHKAEKNKQGQPKDPRGIVTHLSDVARRKTEKQDTKEGKIDFAKKIQKNVDKSNKAVVKTNKEVGSRVADIGAGGKEYNVKTDKAWDDAQKAKKAK